MRHTINGHVRNASNVVFVTVWDSVSEDVACHYAMTKRQK